MADTNLGEHYKDAVHATNATLYNEKTAKASDKAIDALAHGDVKGYAKGIQEVNKDALEALGQEYKDAVHATNATLYNEKTAKASDKAIVALAHGDVKGYAKGIQEVNKDALEALKQDAQDVTKKVRGMFSGGAHEVHGAPHEVAKLSTGVKPPASEVQKS